MSKHINFKWRGEVNVNMDIPVPDYMTEKEIEHCRNGLSNGLFENELKDTLIDELEAKIVEVKRKSIRVSKVRAEDAD